jgi:hypothetical protein
MMNANKTPKVIAGWIHHLSVRRVRSLILARPGEKTPDIFNFSLSFLLKNSKAKSPLMALRALGDALLERYEISHKKACW